MSQVTIMDTDYACLWFHPESKVVHHYFKTVVTGDHFREVLNRGIDLLEEHQACKWLSDDRNNSALTPEDSQWAFSDWEPRVLAAGWKYWAIVLPQGVVGRMDMARNVAAIKEAGLETAVFADPAEALAWLESV
jgi:hypothetical protein